MLLGSGNLNPGWADGIFGRDTLTYDGNGNLIEAADADETDLSAFASCNSAVRARFGHWHRQERHRSCASHRECS